MIKKILVHLELWEEFSKKRPPPLALQGKGLGDFSGVMDQEIEKSKNGLIL